MNTDFLLVPPDYFPEKLIENFDIIDLDGVEYALTESLSDGRAHPARAMLGDEDDIVMVALCPMCSAICLVEDIGEETCIKCKDLSACCGELIDDSGHCPRCKEPA